MWGFEKNGPIASRLEGIDPDVLYQTAASKIPERSSHLSCKFLNLIRRFMKRFLFLNFGITKNDFVWL